MFPVSGFRPWKAPEVTTIKTCGFAAQDTAVLIDGMRFRDAASISGDATSFLGDMNIIDTERIEVLRGSGSSLYGSNALGGVITSRHARVAAHPTVRFLPKAAVSG